MDLRKFLKTQTVFLDLEANNLAEIMEVLLENMVNNNMVTYDKCGDIMNAVLQDHTHQFEGLRKVGKENSRSKVQPFLLPSVKKLKISWSKRECWLRDRHPSV